MIVAEKPVDFKTLEAEIFKLVCGWGCELLKQAFEWYDTQLMLARDRRVYRHKGPRATSIKTVMGTVPYKRGVYIRKNEDGTKDSVYLLDEAMGIEGVGQMSGLLSEMVAQAACEGPYRSASRSVSEMTGQTISHTAAWSVVQKLGERIDTQEAQAAVAAAENGGSGSLETPVLFEEQDGIWLKLQGKDRQTHGSSKEMKVGIAYDGAEKVGKKRYRLTNKVACANFESAEIFKKRKEGVIAGTYNTDEINIRLLNGDGAEWIKPDPDDESVYFQLDQFHRNQAITKWVKDEEKRKLLVKLLYEKRIDSLLGCIEGYINCLDDTVETEAAEKENLEKLYTYFSNNKDGLIPCHRRGLDIPPPPDGKEYRRMGCMESNIFTIIGNRMKGHRTLWSIKGGNNLARLLCLKHTGKLTDTLEILSSVCLPLEYVEEIVVKMTAAKAPKYDGKGYEPVHGGAFPALPEFKWLRDIGRTGGFII